MSARTKLNGIFIAVVLCVAALAGSSAQSWTIFVFVAIVGAGIMIHADEVRLRSIEPGPSSIRGGHFFNRK